MPRALPQPSGKRRGISFGAGLLFLLASLLLLVVGALLAVGWYASARLEESVLAWRVRSLEASLSAEMEQGLQRFADTQQALAISGIFEDSTLVTGGDPAARRAFLNMIEHHQSMAAGHVGFDNGHFLYVARLDRLSDARRREIIAPDNAVTAVRTIDENGDRWAFFDLDGVEISGRARRRQDYDPRVRDWFKEAIGAGRTIMTRPYRFAGAGGIGVTIATPLKGGGAVIGADMTLSGTAQLLKEHEISESSLILLAYINGDLLARSGSTPVSQPWVEWALTELRPLVAARGESFVATRRINGTDIRLQVRALPVVLNRRLYIVIMAPVAELRRETRELMERSVLVACVAVVVALIAGVLASRALAAPLTRIADKTDRFRHLDFSSSGRVDSRVREIMQLDEAVERMRDGLDQFARYVPRLLVQQVVESPSGVAIGGVRQPVSVLITDIAGFSQTAEAMEPELLVERLSKYLACLGGAVIEHGGTIDKYIGDSIMAIWNAPAPDEAHAANACRAALAVAHASRLLEIKWIDRGRPAFRTRCGVHTGAAIVGNIGSLDRMNYTVVGGVPNIASRIEALNKVYGTHILASDDVVAETRDLFLWREIDRVVPAGMTRTLTIHELMGEWSSDATADEPFTARWHEALAAYRQGDMSGAVAAFQRLAAERPEDGPSRAFLSRTTELLRSGVPVDWDGTTVFREK
jgi:adenylate cyclase